MTVSELLSLSRYRYPAIDDDLGLTLFNAVHKELSDAMQLRNVPFDVELTEGEMEYDLPPEYVKIHEAYYVQEANNATWLPLIPRSYDEYVVMRPGWRISNTNSQPTEFSVTSAADGNSGKAQIAIWQRAPQTTLDGYPVVRVYTSTVIPLELDDDLPSQIQSEMVYLYGVYYRYLALKQGSDPKEFASFKALFESEKQANIVHVKDVQTTNEDVQFIPNHMLTLTRTT